MKPDNEGSQQLDRAELLRRQKEVREQRARERQGIDRIGGGKRHRHDSASAHFRLRSGRKG